jgi:hypothetical protein
MQGWMSLLSPSTPSQRTSSFGSKSRFQSTSNGFTGGRCRKPGYSGGSRHSLPAAQASVNSPCDSVVNNQRIQNTALIYTPAGQPCVHPAKLPNLQKPYPYLILYRLPYPVSCLPYPQLCCIIHHSSAITHHPQKPHNIPHASSTPDKNLYLLTQERPLVQKNNQPLLVRLVSSIRFE